MKRKENVDKTSIFNQESPLKKKSFKKLPEWTAKLTICVCWFWGGFSSEAALAFCTTSGHLQYSTHSSLLRGKGAFLVPVFSSADQREDAVHDRIPCSILQARRCCVFTQTRVPFQAKEPRKLLRG